MWPSVDKADASEVESLNSSVTFAKSLLPEKGEISRFFSSMTSTTRRDSSFRSSSDFRSYKDQNQKIHCTSDIKTRVCQSAKSLKRIGIRRATYTSAPFLTVTENKLLSGLKVEIK